MPDDRGGPPAPGGEKLFRALCVLQARCRENAAGLPQREALPDVSAGLLFRIGERSLLAPLEEVDQVLEVPEEFTLVPGTKDWVFGVANNRGTLLPMFDLRAFLFGSATSRSARNRVLVVRRNGSPVGLLVSDVTGIRHFEDRSQLQQAPELPEALQPFATGGFSLEGHVYPMLSVRRLTLEPEFNLTAI